MRTFRIILPRHSRHAGALSRRRHLARLLCHTPMPPLLGHHKDAVCHQEGYRAQPHCHLPAHFFLFPLLLGDLTRSGPLLLHFLTLPTPHPVTTYRTTALLVALSLTATSSCLSRPNAALPLGLSQAPRHLRHVTPFPFTAPSSLTCPPSFTPRPLHARHYDSDAKLKNLTSVQPPCLSSRHYCA